jgi:hypothetical protein
MRPLGFAGAKVAVRAMAKKVCDARASSCTQMVANFSSWCWLGVTNTSRVSLQLLLWIVFRRNSIDHSSPLWRWQGPPTAVIICGYPEDTAFILQTMSAKSVYPPVPYCFQVDSLAQLHTQVVRHLSALPSLPTRAKAQSMLVPTCTPHCDVRHIPHTLPQFVLAYPAGGREYLAALSAAAQQHAAYLVGSEQVSHWHRVA